MHSLGQTAHSWAGAAYQFIQADAASRLGLVQALGLEGGSMKYPLNNHKTGDFFPASGKCGYCDESTNGRFGVMSFSAMTEFAPGRLAPAEVQTTFGFFDHGATKSGAPLNIFENTKDALFCSTVCLRGFLNQLVTDFENLEA